MAACVPNSLVLADDDVLSLRKGTEILQRSRALGGGGEPLRVTDAADESQGRRLRTDARLTPTVESGGGILRDLPRIPAEVDEALSDSGSVSSKAVVGPSVAGAPATEAKPANAAPSWRFVPISWSGNLGSDYGFSAGDIGTSSFSQTDRLSLRANSFVWQPWFANLTGSLSLGRTSVTADSKATANTVGVGSRLNLFPQSRFPIDAYFDVNTSSASSGSGGSGTKFTSQLFGISNNYRPEDGRFTASGGIQHSNFDSGSGAKTSQTQFSGAFTPKIETEVPQSLSADVNYTIGKSEAPATGASRLGRGAETNTLRMRTTHGLNLEDWYGLTLNSEASYDSNTRRDSVGADITTAIALAQTQFTWQPIEDLPLRLNGSVRAQQFATKAGAQDLTINSLFGQVATTYNLSQQWSVSGGLSSSLVSSGQASTTALSANAGLSYRGMPLKFGGFDYSHGASTTASMSLQSQGNSLQTLGASFNHGVARPVPIGEFGSMSLSVNQSYFTSVSNSARGNTFGVGTGASLSWTIPSSDRYSLSAMLNGSDSRTFGNDSSGSQSIGATINGGMALSAYSTGSASLTANFSRRLESVDNVGGLKRTTPAEGWVGFGGGQLNYTHSKFFNVPRLEYIATYNLTIRSASALNGASNNAPTDTSGFVLDHTITQAMNYRLGRLSFRLSNSISIANDGTTNYSIFLNVNRELGGVLNF